MSLGLTELRRLASEQLLQYRRNRNYLIETRTNAEAARISAERRRALGLAPDTDIKALSDECSRLRREIERAESEAKAARAENERIIAAAERAAAAADEAEKRLAQQQRTLDERREEFAAGRNAPLMGKSGLIQLCPTPDGKPGRTPRRAGF